MVVKIGLLGTGIIAEYHAKALAKIRGARIVALCDKAPGKAEAFAGKHKITGASTFRSHKRMLSQCDLDAVFVMLPPYAHGPEKDVIAAGRHLFVEKPLHLAVAEAEKIRDAARRRGLVTCTGYQTRYRRSVRRVKGLLGRVAQPTLLFGGWHTSAYLAPWWIDKKKSGGQHLEQTTHTFDLARHFFGEAASLHAVASKGAFKIKGFTIEDASCVNVKFRNGAIGNIMSSCVTPEGAGSRIGLSVYTRKFVAHFEEWAMGVTIHTARKGEPHVEKIKGETQDEIFLAEDGAFVKAAATGRQDAVLSSYADGVESLRLTTLASESMKTGRPVCVGRGR